jgi:hypothetical protein
VSLNAGRENLGFLPVAFKLSGLHGVCNSCSEVLLKYQTLLPFKNDFSVLIEESRFEISSLLLMDDDDMKMSERLNFSALRDASDADDSNVIRLNSPSWQQEFLNTKPS